MNSKSETNCEFIFGQRVCDELPDFDIEGFLKKQDEKFKDVFQGKDKRQEYKDLIKKIRLPYIGAVENCGGDYVAWINFGSDKNLPVAYVMNISKNKRYQMLDSESENAIPQTLTGSKRSRYVIIGLFKTADPQKRYAKVYDFQSSKLLDDRITGLGTLSFAWDANDEGFFYMKRIYPHSPETAPPAEMILYHKLGTPVENDILIQEFPGEKYNFWKFQVFVTNNGKYLIVIVSSDKRGNLLYFGKLPDGNIRKQIQLFVIVNKWKRKFKYVTSEGDKIILITDRLHPNKCLTSVDLNNPKPLCHCEKYWKVLLKETSSYAMYDAARTRDSIFFTSLHHGLSAYGLYDMKSEKVVFHSQDKNIIVLGLSGSLDNDFTYFRSESVIRVPLCFNYFDQKKNKFDWFPDIVMPPVGDYTELNYFLEIIWKDDSEANDEKKRTLGILFGKKDKKNEKRPCLVIVDGGFGHMNLIIYRPFFFYFLDIWNFFIVIATLPGGGEYGRKWHNKGRGVGKKKSLEYLKLLANKLKPDRTSHLILYGERNGGLLSALAIMKLPKDLFSCVIIRDGVMDILNIGKERFGKYFIEEYGNPRKSVGFFGNAMELSPLRNTKLFYEKLQESQISILFVLSDDRIVPKIQSAKTAAILIARVPQGKTINLFVYHNPSWYIDVPKPYTMDEEASVNMFGFIGTRLNIELDVAALMKELKKYSD